MMPIRSKLDYLKIALCGDCNYSCNYCSQEALRSMGMLDMDLLMQHVLSRVVPRLIILTGGEPLLHSKGVETCAEYCAQNSVELGIFSNLAPLHIGNINWLKQVSTVWLRTTINGASARAHELSYPPGSFEDVLRGVSLAVENGVRVKARMTVTRENLGEIEATADLVANLGIAELDFRPFAPLGAGNTERLQLKVEEHIAAAKRILALGGSSLVVRLLPNWFEYAFAPTSDTNPAFCNCGKTYLYIDPRGVVRPCAGYGLELGSILENDIESIFMEAPFLMQVRREEFGSYCTRCPAYSLCRPANCHLMNYEAFGSLNSVNPLCPLYRLDPGDPKAAQELATAIYAGAGLVSS